MNGIIFTVNRKYRLQEVVLKLFFPCILLFTSTGLIASENLVRVESGNIYYGSGNESKHLNSGAYNWYWLFSPEGKEIGPLGDRASAYSGDD